MLKKLLTYLGSIIAIISLVFVAQQLVENWQKVGPYQFTTQSISIIFLGIIGYCIACYLLSAAWYKILASLCSSPISAEGIKSIYARSQIAKYIPGNVMQIAGRHILTRRLGIGHKLLAIASLTEIVGLVMASCTLTVIGSVIFGLWESYINQQQLLDGVFTLCIILSLIPIIRYFVIKFIPISRPYLNNPSLFLAFFIVYLKYVVFFIIVGTILVGLVYQLDGELSIYQIAAIIATFSVSWLLGFITPGAPSGIGIRETILVVSLDKILLGSTGVLIAILFRVITVGGDVLFFSIAGRKSIS
ncbi:MAG: hypothetical protein L3J59_09275 [Methylococcaceae bacterium]|nr:hypothetical protein [Methylococcaceae bacterium]